MLVDRGAISLLKSKIHSDGYLDLPANGNSMFPLIQKGDICRFILTDPSQLKKGDILLFHFQSGQLVAHRYIYTSESNNLPFFHLKGDSNLGFDKPIQDEQIIGILAFIQRGKKKIGVNEFSASLWRRLILSFPILSEIVRRYINRKNL
jgi:signal peptidase